MLGLDLTGLGASPGNYEDRTNTSAISPKIDARNLNNGKLIIRRWLNVDAFVHDSAIIEGYKHGWNTIWQAAGYTPTTDNSWTRQTYDVSSLADRNSSFQVRFRLLSDYFTNYSGWNVDDVILKDGSLPDDEACGGCANKPSFAGLSSAVDINACGDSGVSLAWPPAAAWGSARSGTYAVYRDTVPNFVPSASNRLVAGLTVTSYTDSTAPNSTALYYLVRAENSESCSNGPNNSGVQDDNSVYLQARDDVSQPVPASIGSSLRLSDINDAHARLTWSAATGAASYNIYRANNPQMAGAQRIGSTSQLLYEDVGELTTAASRYYLVKGVNSCGVEGP